jgi:hypothetical protein
VDIGRRLRSELPAQREAAPIDRPVGCQHSVEMIDLVLQKLGEVVTSDERTAPPCQVFVLNLDLEVATNSAP